MRSGQQGFTLIEAGTVLAIIAIVAALALPSFEQLLQRRHVEGVAAELAADMQYLRSQAVARNRAARVSFSTLPSGASCYVMHTGAASACTCNAEGRSACGADASALKAVLLPAGGRAQVAANVASIVFDPTYGTSTPAATLRVTGRDGSAIHHVVNLLGRLRSCSPAGALAGYRAC